MKLEKTFDKFLQDVVNLNATRYDTASSGIEVIGGILENDDIFGDKFINLSPQGSFRQETIIRPAAEDLEFDVDILFEMKKVDDWEPKDYLEKLANQFKSMDRYKDKVDTRGKNRCVTIDYESDFHIDIVPAINMGSGCVIMNKNTNSYEETDGEGYALWFEKKNNITEKKLLTKVVRLIKYIRDYHDKFDIKSILLTTILGNQVLENDNLSELYPDLPTAFFTLITRLDTYLQLNPSIPIITNPVLESENFNRHWSQNEYESFRKCIHDYSQKTQEAYFSEDETESIEKWQEIFGEKLMLQPDEKKSEAVVKRDFGEKFLSDFGIKENLIYSLKVDAKGTEDGFQAFTSLRSLRRTLLGRNLKLEFFIKKEYIPEPYSIMWKVKNYGEDAANHNDLRGEITNDCGHETKKENTKYFGRHYVECYIIKNDICIAKDRVPVIIGHN